ncbi:acyltransferase family protein [Spirosoma agri]|uniref:Acyltransferase n=1 Tax=Spirosoma agri TaxID=1987381 RepID=A0A6M0IP36_9BACT|nr:acyltransferase [Spirosoma agri]NEU69325.1 acyltransferase [Spirosoma agri]
MSQLSQQRANTNYIPGLDGFRGVAILLVVFSHYGYGHILPGGFGVTLFFFISGLLITRLMIAEYEKKQRIDMKSFYARRLLRLYPALLFMVVIAVLFTILIGCEVNMNEILSTVFYYRNYYMIYATPEVSAMCSKVYNIVWSLAVEEHFYIVFPILFIVLFRWNNLFIGILIAAIIGAMCWRLHIASTQGLSYAVTDRIYRSTDTRFDAILFGCLTSLVLHRTPNGSYIRFAGHWLPYGVAALLLLFTLVYRDLFFRETIRYTVQGMALSVLVPATLYHKTYSWLLTKLSVPWLIQVGKVSYSLYMFHWVGVCFAEHYVTPYRATLPWMAVAASVGIVLTLISYLYVEKPTMKLRKRFGSNVDVTEKMNINPVASH